MEPSKASDSRQGVPSDGYGSSENFDLSNRFIGPNGTENYFFSSARWIIANCFAVKELFANSTCCSIAARSSWASLRSCASASGV